MVKRDFVILGCGISGLTLANELLKKGCKVTLFEKNKFVGGLASTNLINGFPIDTGPHIFHSAHKEIIDYWRDLVGDSLKKKDFYSGNFQDKKIYDYPINKETMRNQYNEKEIQIIEKELSKSKSSLLCQPPMLEILLLSSVFSFCKIKFNISVLFTVLFLKE